MSLLRPIRRFSSRHSSGRITQTFDGAYSWELPGYLRGNHGKRSWFPRSVRRSHLHLGIDYAAPEGTPVLAVHDGTVMEQGKYDFTGERYLLLRVKRSLRYQVVALYTHLLPGSFRFKVGQSVTRGDVVALSGDSGWSDGPHLHFAIVRLYRWQSVTYNTVFAGMAFDPQPFIDGAHLTRIV
jgi:murein DD-endopeptidase MepM/ murein hydrolase activator NlpD